VFAGGDHGHIFQGRAGRIAVDAEPEQPRFMLLSVAYALKASDADTVGGQAGERVSCWRPTSPRR